MIFLFSLERQMIFEGNVPYVGTYPPIGIVNAQVRKIEFPATPFGSVDYILSFPKPGKSTDTCNDPALTLSQGQSITDFKALFGVSKPNLPITLVACLGKRTPFLPDLSSVFLHITIRSNGPQTVTTPILLFGITCPGDEVVEALPGQSSAIVDYPSATTNDPQNERIVCSPPSGSSFPVGTTTVTCIADDGFGNTADCTFRIVVKPPNTTLTLNCPPNIRTATAEGESSVVVNYPLPVANISQGTIVACSPPPDSGFPVGITTVTCTATNTSRQSATCSFNVIVRANTGFDICLQDEGNHNFMLINSATGDYQFTACDLGLQLNGRGRINDSGAVIVLEDNQSDRRVLAGIDISVKQGTASINLFSLGRTFIITDENTANNTCACP